MGDNYRNGSKSLETRTHSSRIEQAIDMSVYDTSSISLHCIDFIVVLTKLQFVTV